MTPSETLDANSWNAADIALMKRGRGKVSKCSSPREAKIFLARKILHDCGEIQFARTQVRGFRSKLKWRAKQALRAESAFGPQAHFGSTRRIQRYCTDFLSRMSKESGVHESVRLKDNFNPENYRSDDWSEILEIGTQVRNANGLLILQGSRADLQTTRFSDFDLVLFGRLDDTRLKRLKSDLERIVLRADPLQHHGVFFYAESIRDYYPEAILPIETIRRSVSLDGNSRLDFRVLNDRYAAGSALFSLTSALTDLVRHCSPRGLWDWKYNVSQFLLLPTLLLACHGRYVYKGDSFGMAKCWYGAEAWNAIEELTRVRMNWPSVETNLVSHYQNAWGQRVCGRLDSDPLPVPDSLASWKTKDFRESATLLINETLSRAGFE